MCNPRQVTINATRELNVAWQREVTRTARLSASVAGEARVRHSLGATLSPQALEALELAFDQDGQWERQEDGTYRHEVEGGYVIYLPEGHELEIVARREDEVDGLAEVSDLLEGTVQGEVTATGEGMYYDDEWGGHTEEKAASTAEKRAERELDAAERAEVERAGSEAESEAAEGLEAKAQAAAREDLQRKERLRREELEAQARERLDAVGVRCRRAFNRVLGTAYRDVLLEHARRDGAEVVQQQEDDATLELELRYSR